MQVPRIAGDSVIRVVPAKLRRQGGLLLSERDVAVLAAPLHDRLQRPAEAALGRLALHRPVPLERPAPVVGEPQEIARTGAADVGDARGGVPRRPLERDLPGLLRMEGQAVLPESLRQHVQDPSRVAFHFEDQDRVVGVTDQGRPPLQARFDRLLEPCVQDLVQVGVG